MLKTSILISYLINNSLLERYLNDYLLYIDFYLDPRKQKVWLDQNYRLKTIEYKSFKVLNKKLYFFVNPLTRRKREEGYRDFFLNQFKVTLNIDLYSEDIFTFTPYEDLENVLTGSTQGVGHLFYELPKFFFEKKNLGNYSLKNSSLFFTNQKEFLDLENFPDFFWPENFFLKRFLVQDFKYKLEPELLQLQDLSLEPKFNKFYKSVFYGFRKYIIPIYNKILLDYRIIFFQAMVIIYKNVNLEVPLILQLGSEFPVTYSKIRVSTKKKPINRYTPLLYEPLLIDNAYSEGGLGALAINSSFFYKKKILSIKFKHETYFYQDEFKNEELYKSYAKQQFALFNEVKYKAKKLYTLYETFGYDWKHNIIRIPRDIELSDNVTTPCVFFRITERKYLKNNILKKMLFFNKHDWVFTFMFYETLFLMQSYLTLFLFKKKQIIYKNFSFLLRISYEEENLAISYDNFLGFLTLHTSLWDKRYFIKHIILRNAINKDFYKFHELTTEKLVPVKKPYYKFFFKKKIFLKRKEINIPRVSMRNWLTSDSSYVGSKMESRKFYSQVARMVESRGDFIIFTKKEKHRIYRNIQTRNAFYGFGREMLANNLNYRYSEALANDFALKMHQNFKIKKKKSLVFFFKEVQYNLFSVSYILFNMKSTVRDRIAKPYLPYFGINFLSSITPYFHGYPTFKKKIRNTHPIFFSSMKNYTGLLFEDILKSILNLNNTSHLLQTLKNSNFFFNKIEAEKCSVFPTVDNSTKVFLNGYLNVEDWYPLSTAAIPYPGSDCYFSQFIPSKLINNIGLDSLQNTVLKKNVSFFLNLFINKPSKSTEKKQKYSTISIMKMRNFVFLKNQRKKIFILNQSSYIPDFMGYFRSKKEPYHRLNITNYSKRADPITNYYQYENKAFIREGYVEGKFAQEEEEEEEIFDNYDYNLSKRPESLQDYAVLIVTDHIYNWASLELKKSLGETVEKTEYVSEQRFQLLELPPVNILTMDQDTYELLKSYLLSLRSFEADYIACNEQLYVTDLFLDEN